MNRIWLVVFQISIYLIICIDSQQSWWTDEFGDSDRLTGAAKTVHRHRHHHQQTTHQTVRHKFMADNAHSVPSSLKLARENGNADSEFRNRQGTVDRNGHRQMNRKHSSRKGQRQKHHKNGNQTRRDQTAFSISLFYWISIALSAGP